MLSNTLTRTLSGSVYILIIIGALLWHPAILGVVSLLINIVALREMDRIGNKMGLNGSPSWIIVNSVFLAFALIIIDLGLLSNTWLVLMLILPVWYFVAELYGRRENPVLHVAFINFSTFFVSLPLVLLNLIQQHSRQQEVPFALAMFIMIWTNDTFAYLSGMAVGKHKMFERISPKKTWEGFAGGLIMVFVAAFIFHYFFPSFGLVQWFLFGLLTALSAVMGDFLESLLKRTAGVKDSGNIMPGHGGLLDRIDSLLLAGPVIFLYIVLIQNL